MMVDGSTISPPPHQGDSDNPPQEKQEKKEPLNTTAISQPPPTESSASPPVVKSPPVVAEETSVTTTGRSRWNKLRHTVQLSSAITQVNRKPPLKREDSFLKRFSTRPIPDPNAIEGSSRLAGEGMVKSHLLGVWRSVVNPDENILFYWLSLVTICLLYNAWTIIVRQAFPELQEGWSTLWYFLDGFTDVVFILDIAFQFRTGYLEQGLMVCESKKLAGHYLKSKSFLLDIISITPLDLLQVQFGVMPVIRFPRFLKLYRSFRLYYMVESRTIYPNLWRVVNLIHILLLLAHWFGCFYYLLSEFENFVGEWSYRKPVDDYATLSRKYLGSVYWSTLTLTTIGDLATPATNLQYMFTIISYLIGVFIFATIVGQVGTVITNRNASRLEFERLLDGAKLYMRHHKVPRNMQRRVQRWYDYSWSRGRMQGGGDINSALGILPDKLKTELALHVNLKTLKKVSIFQECQPEFLHDLVLKMRAYIFTPGDLICRKGEVAREMFIIADGILEVISETGKVLTQMKAGDFFGEIGILNLDGFNRRTADVRSVGYSELFSLSREDILAAMKDYPEAQDILQTMGRKRLMEARLAANIGRTGGTNADSNSPAGQGQSDGEKNDSAKPKSAVSKITKDVLSLKKLLRTRSTMSGNASDSETIEMKPMPSSEEVTSSSNQDATRKKNVSFKTLIQKIQFKREDSTTSVKNFTDKLTTFRSRAEKNIADSSSASTDDSADSTTPLNKSLPLLQRVRLLGAQEKKNADMLEPLNTSNKSPLLKISKITEMPFQKKETGSTSGSSSKESSPKFGRFEKTTQLLIPKEDNQTSPKSKSNPLSSILTSALSMGSTSPRSSKKLSPKKEASPENKKCPPSPKSSRLPEGASSEIPLLKKVLLRKVMDEKKPDGSRNILPENQESSGNNIADGNTFSAESNSRNEDISEDTVSNRVYLEQFSRTLGFQMSEDVAPSLKPQPRPRLNASSLTPSPSKENISTEATLRNEDSNSKEENKIKSPPSSSECRRRLSRMMAVREDSDEHSVLGETDDDPFVKSTECQTEIVATDVSPTNAGGLGIKKSEVDTELSKYLMKIVCDLETVIKAYSMEQQQDLMKENETLKKETQEKDNLIKKLLSKIEEQNHWENFEEISSLGTSSLSVSETREDNQSDQKVDSDCDEKSADDSDVKDLDDEESRVLQESVKLPRKSWPSSAFNRYKLGLTRQSCSLDDESQKIFLTEPENMWRMEFPPPPPDMSSRTILPQAIYPMLPESLVEEVFSKTEEAPKIERSMTSRSDNDWEVRMLVEQFEQNVHQSRRHSSGDALTWDRVLKLRNSIRTKNPPASTGVRAGRKFSLIEDSAGRPFDSTHYGNTAEASSIISQSSSYSSLTSIEHQRNFSVPETKTSRSDSKPVRRKNNGAQSHQSRSTGRKCSLPIIQPISSINMARWLSMEDVKSENNQDHESNHRTSISSGCSQETVIEVDTRCSSTENIQCPNETDPRLQLQSNPNISTAKDSNFTLDLTTAPRISDWPSSPCLPTIREDEQSYCASHSTSKSSPGRSFSHDCLPKTFAFAEIVQNNRKENIFQRNIDSFHSSETLCNTTNQPSNDSVILDIEQHTHQCNDNTADNQHFCDNQKKENISSARVQLGGMTSLKDNPKSLSQTSVVITIPKYEPVLSP